MSATFSGFVTTSAKQGARSQHLAMEFVERQTMENVLAAGREYTRPLVWREVLDLFVR